MSRWSNNLDDPVMIDGDRFFEGYNSKLGRNLLPEGMVPVSINKRFNDKSSAPRLGVTMPVGNRFWIGTNPIAGSFVFTDKNGKEKIILAQVSPVGATTGSILAYDINADTLTTISLPVGIIIGPSSSVWFSQGFGNLVALISDQYTGAGGAHVSNGYIWDGVSASFTAFAWVGTTNRQVIPPSLFGISISNRMVYWNNFLPPTDVPSFSFNGNVYDHLLVSDTFGAETGAFQNMDPVLFDFFINTGLTDQIVAVVPYAFDTAIIFMKRSISSLTNFSIYDPTIFTVTAGPLAKVSVLTQYMGCTGVRAVLQIGSEIYFVSQNRGVFKLSEILDQRIVVPPLPISDDIQPDIDRINWTYASTIVLASENNYMYMAAPIDGQAKNKAIFVYNLTTSKWETIDFFSIPNFSIDNMMPIHINSVRRLIAVQNNPPLVYLLYDGNSDQTAFSPATFTGVSDYMETRGYGLGKDVDPSAWGTFHRGSIVMRTVNPNVTITAITEGVNESKVLRSNLTKDPTKIYIHGLPPLVDEKRQDYSGLYTPVPQQTTRERFQIRMTDRWLSLAIANTQGTCNILSTSVELTESRRNARTAA